MKRILLSRLLVSIFAISCLNEAMLQATETAMLKKAKESEATDHEAEITKAADYILIERASKIICEFCLTIKEFFSKGNTESFDTHLDRFAKIIASIDLFNTEIQSKFEKTKSVKYKAFLDILIELKNKLDEAYGALQTRKATTIMATFRKCLNKTFINGTKAKLENTKKYLTENETKLINNIADSSENILKNLPGDISCACIISNIVKR